MITNTSSFQLATAQEFLQSRCQNRVLKAFLPWTFWIAYDGLAQNSAGFYISRGFAHDTEAIYNGTLAGFTPTSWGLFINASLCVYRDPNAPNWVYSDPSYGNFNLEGEEVNGVWLVIKPNLFDPTIIYVRGEPGVMTGTGSFHRPVGGGLYAPAFQSHYLNGTVSIPGGQGYSFFDSSWIAGDIFCFWVGKTVAELPASNFNPNTFLKGLPTSNCDGTVTSQVGDTAAGAGGTGSAGGGAGSGGGAGGGAGGGFDDQL